MKRLILAIVLAILAFSIAYSATSDFVLGGYSQFQLIHAQNPTQIFDSLGVFLEEAGYNTVLYSMYDNDVEQGKLQQALAGLARHKLYSVIDDWIGKDNGPVGVTPMTFGLCGSWENDAYPQLLSCSPVSY